MNNIRLKKELVLNYKVFRISEMVDDDLQYIRKLNNILKKYKNSKNNDKKEYYLKIIRNILKTLDNIFYFEDIKEILLKICKNNEILKEVIYGVRNQ